MEENDTIDKLLSQYFSSKREETLTHRFIQIRALQDATKQISTEASTLWRVVLEALKVARVDPKDLALLADISDEEAQYIVAKVQPEPFGLPARAVAHLLITLKLSIKKLETLLINALLAQNSSKKIQRTVARSSDPLGNRERARAIQDGINAVFIQIHNEQSAPQSDEKAACTKEDQTKLSAYLSLVIAELKRNEADYLLS